MINVENDEIRSLGIRSLKSYLTATSTGPDEVLSLGPSLTQGRDVDHAKVSDVAANVKRASNRIRDRLAEGDPRGQGTSKKSSETSINVINESSMFHLFISNILGLIQTINWPKPTNV